MKSYITIGKSCLSKSKTFCGMTSCGGFFVVASYVCIKCKIFFLYIYIYIYIYYLLCTGCLLKINLSNKIVIIIIIQLISEFYKCYIRVINIQVFYLA